jgi:hypothetical protein
VTAAETAWERERASEPSSGLRYRALCPLEGCHQRIAVFETNAWPGDGYQGMLTLQNGCVQKDSIWVMGKRFRDHRPTERDRRKQARMFNDAGHAGALDSARSGPEVEPGAVVCCWKCGGYVTVSRPPHAPSTGPVNG